MFSGSSESVYLCLTTTHWVASHII